MTGLIKNSRSLMLHAGTVVFVACLGAATGFPVMAATPQVAISPIPLTLVAPTHPQVLIAVGNSESMDGNLSGAIMTGSGLAPSQLYASSSPQNFVIPPGFTPPINAGSSGSAPYTVACGANLCDNSPSRLNVAKQSLTSILNTYAGDTDFGLLDYSVRGMNNYTTWVYYMSQAGGFTFSSTNTPAPPSGEYVPNPCYTNTGADTVSLNCSQIAAQVGLGLTIMPWMLVQNSSDDPSVNDVLYAGGQPPVFLTYGGHTPANPFTYFTIANYNSGAIYTAYNSCVPIGCIKTTYTTNAGFIPSSDQVLYAQRGFGYGSSGESANSGNTLVPMTTAGTNPTPAQVQTMISNFTPFLAPETNKSSTNEIKASAGQSPLAGLLTQAYNVYTSNGGKGPASNNGCPPQRYVVLVTDGLPTQDLSGNNWPPLGTLSASGFGVTASFDPATGALTSTNDTALQDTVTVLGNLLKLGVKTYIVGLGAGVNPATNPQAAAALKAMAVAGGTNNYLAATTPAAVTADLQAVLSAIQGQNLSTSSAAVNSTGLRTGSVAYQAQFTTDSNPWQDWTGNLQAYPVNPSTGLVNTSTPVWQAGTQLDSMSPTSRVIATWNPGSATGVPFEWSNISATQQTELKTSSTDTFGAARLVYLRGDKSNEQQNCGPPSTSCGGFRNRSHTLGDIVNSNPLYIGASQGPYANLSQYQTSYAAYEQATASREPMIYVGANDGMLHAFDAATGQEKFAFVPNGVFANLINLSNPTYNQAHQWFVDGSPNAGDVAFSNGSWHTLLVGGLNGGGNSIYALDVTNPAGITSETTLASDVLWEFTDSTLGLTYSRPFIALTGVSSTYSATPFLVFFGSGYDNSDGNDYLYALNAQTGALVEKINLCAAVPSACNSSLPNGLSSVVAVNNTGGVGVPATTIYGGDLQGNLWKIDISAANPAKWVVSVLFQARDPSGNPQPITTAPVVSLQPAFPQLTGVVVYFGTGQFLGPADLTNTQTQSFYGVWDNSPATPYTRSKLVQQVVTDNTVTVCVMSGATCTNQTEQVRTVTGNKINWSTNPGWFMDLPDAGERVATNPELFDGALVFTTYAPVQGVCGVGGHSFLMDVNYANGGAFPHPQIDINGDGKLDSSDQVNGTNPIGLGLGNVFAATPTILANNHGSVQAVKLITLSTGQIKSVYEGGGDSGRVSWWQVY